MTTFEHTFDDARDVMYTTLTDEFGAQRVDQALAQAVTARLTDLYDNRDRLATEEQVPEVAANE